MLDKKYDFKEKEIKWMNYWKDNNIYEFKPDKRKIYSIDTPPPTVNGKIHIGHIFSYSQAEMIARYKRIRGYNVFYPFDYLAKDQQKENKEKEHMKQVEKNLINYVMKLQINMKMTLKNYSQEQALVPI